MSYTQNKQSLLSVSELVALDDISFLKAIVARYPETALLAGAAEASPEGNPRLKESALAYKIFDPDAVHPEAIEADRTFLGLLLFKAVLTDRKTYFPNLSENEFEKLKKFTHTIVQSEKDIEFVLYSLACNDLGKTQQLVDEDISLKGRKADDHDQLLAELVTEKPDLFPGMRCLSTEQQAMYRDGLHSNLNLGQLVQGENLPANLAAIQTLPAQSRNLRLLAEIFDFAGATGHVKADASILMNSDNLFCYTSAVEELMIEPLDKAYERYIALRTQKVGLTFASPEDFALGRIVALSRATTAAQGTAIKNVWEKLPSGARSVLTEEFNISGCEGQAGILLYYAPAVIANATKTSGSFDVGLRLSLMAFAEQYKKVRDQLTEANTGVITVNIADVAKLAAKAPEAIVAALYPTKTFSDVVEGDRAAFIGIGGGSDGVQAAVLAHLSGKKACVVSIRTDKTGSQGASGKVGEKRTVENHGGEIVEGVYKMTPETRGSGRFLENIPPELGLPTYLVIDKQDGTLTNKIAAALDDFGQVKAVYAVDTGGDSLYRSSSDDKTKATPDQDRASLIAVMDLGAAHTYSIIVAPGVDTPPYADETGQIEKDCRSILVCSNGPKKGGKACGNNRFHKSGSAKSKKKDRKRLRLFNPIACCKL